MSYTGLSISQTFQAFSIYCSSAATFFYMIYLIKGKKLESNRIKEVETERMKMDNMEEKSSDEVSTISTYLWPIENNLDNCFLNKLNALKQC